MANGRFKASYTGYRAIMNGPPALEACEAQGHRLAASAAAQSGIDYDVNSVRGINRIHTRVTTTSQSDYFRERVYGALSIAVGAAGGHPASGRRNGFKSLMSRVAAADKKRSILGKGFKTKTRDTGWRSPGMYRKKR